MNTLLFSAKEIADIVDSVGFDRLMDATIDGIASACDSFDPAAYSIPVRSGFSYDNEPCKGLVEWMPIIRYGDHVLVKLVAYHPDNPRDFGLPTVLSTIVTFDTRSGHAVSIVDATFLTSLRTGAASAVASVVLAPSTSRSIGLIGAGAQAVTQLHALSRRFSIEQIYVHDIDVAACSSLAHRASYAGVTAPVIPATTQEVIRNSDIICTSTSIEVGDGPVFEDLEVREAVHINAVGSDFPGKTELPVSLLRRSLVCPDFPDQALVEGECQQLDEHEIGPALDELVRNRERYEKYQSSPTVFDSTGWALEDLVVAEILTGLGKEAGCGTPVEISCVSDDPKNPYGFVDRYLRKDERLASIRVR